MNIFQLHKNQLWDLREKPFKLEKEIQNLFEENLTMMTGLEFVKSEFSIQNQRIDTLAYDIESKSFVIIEYKRSHNYSVFDQGVSYLNTLLKFKADFVLTYNETLHKFLKKDEVDWSQSRVVFVSPAFNQVQKQAVDFKDLNIELWEVKRFENDIVVVNGIKKSAASPSVKLSSPKSENSELKEITQELKTYTEEDHLKGKSDEVCELYEEFKQGILGLDAEIEIQTKKTYISFKKNSISIVYIVVQKKELKFIILNTNQNFEDYKKIMSSGESENWGKNSFKTKIKNTQDLEYIMSLVKQTL